MVKSMDKKYFNLIEDTIKLSDTLNPTIWEDFKLKEDVKNKLKEISDAFIKYLDFDFNIDDIQIVGSMANYNFTKYSDIDLHLIADLSEFEVLDKDYLDCITKYFNAKKSLFNQNHNITIYGHPVELYIEDKNYPAKANGKYSILKNDWIIKPTKNEEEIEDVSDNPKYLEYIEKIDDITSSRYNSEEAEELLDELYEIRKNGLLNGGEYAEDNLIFKTLRNNDYIQKLRKYINDNFDESLSLKETLLKETVTDDDYYRLLAKKLALECKKIINNKNKTITTTLDQTMLLINVSNEFNNILKDFNIDEKFYLRFVYSGDETCFNYGHFKNGERYITIPNISLPIAELQNEFINKNKKKLLSLYAISENYSDELKKLYNNWLHNYIKSHTKYLFEYGIDTLIHECIHLLDDLRRTSTYKSKEQKTDTEQDYINYYNSPIEQNAYYQETIYIFDDWIEKILKYKDFNLDYDFSNFKSFLNEFKHQYRGNWDKLNPKNKSKIMKRAYQYWKSIKEKYKGKLWML